MEISLVNQDSRAVINTHGACIIDFKLKNTPILGQFKRGDGKFAATHPCSPIFGPETTTHYGLPQHGPVRNEDWMITRQTENELEITCAIRSGSYPGGVNITQAFVLSPTSLTLKTTHTNTADFPAPLFFAEHCYWCAPQGWRGAQLNGANLDEKIATTSAVTLEARNELTIPGQPLIIITQSGLDAAVLWTYNDPANNTFDTDYFCLEPAEAPLKTEFFGSPASMIEPGEERISELEIAI